MASVLIVDDATFMRMKIRQVMEANEFTVAGEAGDGEEAIRLYTIVKPDVVILDITMPGMNGIETLKHIKEIDPAAKILICSAMGYQELIAQAIQNGAQNFVVKPFQDEHLVAAVNKVLHS